MKILFLAVKGFLERTTHFTYMLPKYLARKGIKVVVFAPKQHSAWTTLEEGVTIRLFNSYRLFHGFEVSPGQWIKLFRLEQKPDIIHVSAYGTLETFFAYLYSKICRIPLVITTDLICEHFLDISPNPLNRLYAKIFARPPMKIAQKIVFTEKEKKLLEEEKYQRINIIPIGIQFHKFNRKINKKKIRKKLGLPIDKKIVISVSHQPIKGTDFILDVAKLLPSVLFLLVGSIQKDYKAHLVKRTRKENINNIVITGPLQLIEDYFFAADAYVCASISESFGVARIEAVASGLPVITTDVGCEGIPGIFVKKRDARDMANKLKGLFSDRKLYQRLSNQRDWAKKFDWDEITAKMIKVYEKDIRSLKLSSSPKSDFECQRGKHA